MEWSQVRQQQQQLQQQCQMLHVTLGKRHHHRPTLSKNKRTTARKLQQLQWADPARMEKWMVKRGKWMMLMTASRRHYQLSLYLVLLPLHSIFPIPFVTYSFASWFIPAVNCTQSVQLAIVHLIEMHFILLYHLAHSYSDVNGPLSNDV